MLRAADGHGAYWTDAIALADDHEPADGSTVLTFWQAQDKARVLVRGENAGGDRPATVADALDAYERDLATRGGAVANARVVRNLLPAALLAKPVGLLTFRELRHWRDGLLDGRKASTVNRTCKSLKAALNLAAAHDPRIGNGAVWRQRLGEPARRAHRPPCRTARARRAQDRRRRLCGRPGSSGSGPRSPRRPARALVRSPGSTSPICRTIATTPG